MEHTAEGGEIQAEDLQIFRSMQAPLIGVW
jgi:hypothetical protein